MQNTRPIQGNELLFWIYHPNVINTLLITSVAMGAIALFIGTFALLQPTGFPWDFFSSLNSISFKQAIILLTTGGVSELPIVPLLYQFIKLITGVNSSCIVAPPTFTTRKAIDCCVLDCGEGKEPLDLFDPLEILTTIAGLNLSKSPIPHFAIQQKEDEKGVFFEFLKKEKRDIDDFKDLEKFYNHILQQKNIEESQYFILRYSLENLHGLYDKYRQDHSVEAMAYKNDILEAIAVALKPEGLNDKFGLDIQRVPAVIIPFTSTLLESQIPLFKMKDLFRVIQLMKEHFPQGAPTLKEVQEIPELSKYLVIEQVPLAKFVHWIYEHYHLGTPFNNKVVNSTITKLAGFSTTKILKPGSKRTKEILGFFRNLGINPGTEVNGKLYSYTEMFEKSLRDEASADGAFQRSLNERGRQILIQAATEAKELNPVISNSFCRLRIIKFEAGSTATPITIEGKTLSDNNTSSFTLQNMFGIFNGLSSYFTNLTNKVLWKDYSAEHLYRTCLVQAVHRKEVTMIVQRLAPDDIHHYVEPVGGRVLSRSQACTKLLQLLEQEGGSPQVEKEKEKETLNKLVEYFNAHHPQKSVVKVKGTKMSVGTNATKHELSPLSQNERKIIMVEHKDGSIAIHTFIGAISVNNVQVNVKPGQIKLGDKVGAMGFGDDGEGWRAPATADRSIKLNSETQQLNAQGEEMGHFDKEGSTVVSLYFNFKPTRLLERAAKRLKYIDARGVERNFEIQTQMGQQIGNLTS